MTDHRYLTIASKQPPLRVTAILGQASPVPADGYGGWDAQTRPRRKDLTIWNGIRPLRVALQIILGVRPAGDGLALNVSAEPDRLALERMAQPPSVGAEPPQVTVTGAIPHPKTSWVIEGFDWDPAPIYRNGILVRQTVTVHLLEYVRDDRLALDLNAAAHTRKAAATKSASSARAAGGSSNQATKQKIYIVKAGDTLSSIAARTLGNYKRWPEIATLNSVRDPKAITVGERLRLP